MELLKNIFIDSLNGFALSDVPLFLFQIICATVLAYILQILLNKKFNESISKHGADPSGNSIVDAIFYEFFTIVNRYPNTKFRFDFFLYHSTT